MGFSLPSVGAGIGKEMPLGNCQWSSEHVDPPVGGRHTPELGDRSGQRHGGDRVSRRSIYQQAGTVCGSDAYIRSLDSTKLKVNNKFIVSLAVSDLIIGIEGIPLFSVYVINGEESAAYIIASNGLPTLGDRWPLGSIACETWLVSPIGVTICGLHLLSAFPDKFSLFSSSTTHYALFPSSQSSSSLSIATYLCATRRNT